MDSSFWFDTINFGWPTVYIGVTGYNFQIKIAFLFLKIIFALANGAEPDEMPHYAAFHLGLHCLPKYIFRSH